METVFNVLHVVSAVFIVGPMAVLPQTALRALRADHREQVATLAKSTNIFSLLSLLVVVLGFGVMGMADEKYGLSFTTPWILWSVILYVIALGLNLFFVVPALNKAAAESHGADGSVAAGGRPSGYGAIAAGSGIVSLLLVVVVVLMVWKP
ncbi:DUF2269 family protein [Luethyella okanaganae]|uniref:DUF2269 family protein n=1 Tax=Luethyella okanaganae TaxID=69372 RepID=A0ABW1VCB0_9MICO